MFNERVVCDYIKKKLGHPYNIIELSDSDIISIFTDGVLKKFSKYFPYETRQILNINDAVPYGSNSFRLDISKNEVISVQNVIGDSNNFIAKYANVGSSDPLNDTLNSFIRDYGKNIGSFKFIHPNILEVYNGIYTPLFLVKVLAVHNKDLTSIPINLQDLFRDYALYNVAEYIYGIRVKYNELNTPFGTLNLNLDFLRELIDKKQQFEEDNFKKVGNFNRNLAGIIVA